MQLLSCSLLMAFASGFSLQKTIRSNSKVSLRMLTVQEEVVTIDTLTVKLLMSGNYPTLVL